MKTQLKNVKVDELERAYDKCLFWFFSYPKRKIGLNDLAKLIRSSKTAVKQAVEKLIEIQFLLKEVAGKTWILSLNFSHPYLITKKVPYHIDKIYESGILEAIHNKYSNVRVIVLFGSYRWGSDDEDSDIDIAVEVLDNKALRIEELGIISQFGYRKNVHVNLHIFSRNKIDLNLFSNIANGFVLEGFLEVRP